LTKSSARNKLLIEVGGLVTKAGLDYLPTNTLYGALLSITGSLETNQAIKDEWTRIGKARLDQEQTS
jgi:Conjugal transfer protein TraD